MTMTPLLVHVALNLFTVSPPTWGELGVYAAALLTLIGVLYTATATRKTGREANAVQFSKTLLERIESLEDDVKGISKSQKETAEILSVSLGFIEKVFEWGRGGGRPPEPMIPSQLRDKLGHLIDEHEER